MSLYASLTTSPPLNRLTLLPCPTNSSTTSVPITVLLTNAIDRPKWDYTVHFHYYHLLPSNGSSKGEGSQAPPHPSKWPYVPLTEVEGEADEVVCAVRTEGERGRQHRRVFGGKLSLSEDQATESGVGDGGNGGGTRVVFAVRYKVDKWAGWRWEEGGGNGGGGPVVGEVLVRGGKKDEKVGEVEVKEVLGLAEGWSVKKTETEGVFAVESEDTMPRVDDRSDAYAGPMAEKVLGTVRDQVRYVSLVRLEPYWLGVQHGLSRVGWEGVFEQSMEAVLVAWLLGDGRVVVMLAWQGGEDVYSVIRSSGEGQVVVGSRNDGDREERWRVLVSMNQGVEEGFAKVMGEARREVMLGGKMEVLLGKAEAVLKETEMAEESWFDGLAYCTWNGMDMHRCNAKGVLEGIQQLEDSGVKLETFLLDDCWQTTMKPTHLDPGWDRFEPNEKFSDGLKSLVREVKAKYPGIKSFGIWHALFGYWGGLAEGGWIASNYKTRKVNLKYCGNISGKMLIVDPQDVERFYDDLYTWLKGEGIDFVKTDVQHMISMLEDRKDREEVPAAYQRAWTIAVLKHFKGKAISCMSQTPQTMFHSLLQDKTPRLMHRNSDDFYPEIIDSNPWHIHVNAFNALLGRNLNTIPDWDMFQTSHPWSTYHGAARAISGGPILITDVPGKHDTALVEAMTAPNPRGTLIALRPRPAATLSAWDSYADGALCRIATSVGDGEGRVGVLGVWNIKEGLTCELIPVRDVIGEETGADVLVRSCRTGQLWGPLKVEGGLVSVEVASRGWDILTAWRVSKEPVVVLGLEGRMLGAAAVVQQKVSEESVKVTLKALGKLGVWIGEEAKAMKSVQVDGTAIAEQYVTSTEKGKGKLFLIDVLAFWQDEGMWSDAQEVVVDTELA